MPKFTMQEEAVAGDLQCGRWHVAIMGSPIDARGQAAVQFLVDRSDQQCTVYYSPDSFTLKLNEDVVNAENTKEVFRQHAGKAVVLEATTLGFVEIYLCIKALTELGFTQITLLYVEPGGYTNVKGEALLSRREFELSAEVPGFKGIPGATLVSGIRSTQRTVFFLGFEERRLDVALETQILRPSDAAAVFGVPAFFPGWEMHSFANNVRVLQDAGLSGGIHFCGAESPAAAYDLLTEINESLLQGERLIVAPIGTKPNGIGVAVFVACNPGVGLLYDHPKRSAGRTSSVARWHLYNIDL